MCKFSLYFYFYFTTLQTASAERTKIFIFYSIPTESNTVMYV